MQKFILFILAIGLIFFLFLLQTGQISKNSFNINNYKKEAEFSIHKNTDIDSITNSSDIYLTINGQDYKIFTFSGNDFHDLVKFQYPLEEYRVPLEAIDAITGTWIGNRYVFYVVKKQDSNTKKISYTVYKTEYATDDVTKLEFSAIKSIDIADTDNSIEVKY